MSPGALRVELITRRQEIPLDAELWNALVAANETNTVFQTYEWFDAWWRTFGRSHELFFLVVRAGQEIVGFAPLMKRLSPFGWREVRFAGASNSDYQDFILPTHKARQLEAVCRFLREHRWSWERLALTNVPSHSSTHPLFTQAAAAAGLHVVDEVRVPCPTLLLGAEGAQARTLVDKYSLRRPLNWFRKHGAVQFRHVTAGEEISRFLPSFFEQHRRRWGNVGKPSLFSDARQMRFYEALAQSLHARGWLQFSVVEFNGEPIAFHFGFDYGGCVTWYKPSFDVRFAERSPGLLLIRELIEDGLNRSRRELDFTIGDEAFKARLTTHQRYNLYFGVYPGRISHACAVAVRDLRRLGGRALRRLKALTRRARTRELLVPERKPA